MSNATEVKKAREVQNEYIISGSAVTVKERASGATLASWDMALLPESIKLRLLAQGGSTILQQRKSNKSGAEAIATMNAHYANWMAGNFEMERKPINALPSWVFPALCLKMPQVTTTKILASLEAKRANATSAEWQVFLASLVSYRKQLAEDDDGELVSLD